MQTGVQNPHSSSELLTLRGSRPLFDEELRARVAGGARCVRFEYCLSFLFATARRQSPVYLTDCWQDRYLWGLKYTLLALALGPWGVPWGLIWAVRAAWVNTTGGADCTADVLATLQPSCRTPSPPAQPNSTSGEAQLP
ncbi:MAG: hypothetical protein K2V38_16400 [Gemmataceae bacterium]|nr:hypothetical protein [Gemmataceae bacterium]